MPPHLRLARRIMLLALSACLVTSLLHQLHHARLASAQDIAAVNVLFVVSLLSLAGIPLI